MYKRWWGNENDGKFNFIIQMTRTTLAINELKKNGLPHLVCITDPTAGGITALCNVRRYSYC